MITTHRHTVAANAGKQATLSALFPAFRQAMAGLGSLTMREVLRGEPVAKWRVMTPGSLPFETALSGRQMKSAQNMVSSAYSSWSEKMVDAVRVMITGSSLLDDVRRVLYRINNHRAWWAPSLELPWLVTTDGELIPCTAKEAATAIGRRGADAAVWLPVSGEHLRLARKLANRARHRHPEPDLRKAKTLTLDATIAKVEPSRTGTFGHWVKIATLTRGKPVLVPLARNTYFDRQLRRNGATIAGVVQLHATGNPAHPISLSLTLDTPDAPLREVGRWVGLDYGMRHALFATSDGQLLGARMLRRLAELDTQLTTLEADLQRRGIRLKTDPAYRTLTTRIRDFVTNEIGRCLNTLARQEGEHTVAGLVVEKLDFRGGGMSRRMNRLITRTGRAVVKARLAALTPKHGITVRSVPAPYSSQQCSGCDYTHRNNRRSSRFTCRFCGLTLHADVNAARVIRSRRSRHLPDHTGPRSRKNTLQRLDSNHRQRWGLPAEGAVPDLAGALGRHAA